MKQTPCYKCEFRTVGCHGSCEKYIMWRKVRDEELARRKVDYEKTVPTERTRKNIVKTGTMSGTLRMYK